jgi:hypothetical protein
MFYFTSFYGEKRSLLFSFYLACYKVLLGCCETVEIRDTYPANITNRGLYGLVQDLVAPFYIFMRADYHSSCRQVSEGQEPDTLSVISRAEFSVPGKKPKKTGFDITIKNGTISDIKIQSEGENSCTSFEVPQ